MPSAHDRHWAVSAMQQTRPSWSAALTLAELFDTAGAMLLLKVVALALVTTVDMLGLDVFATPLGFFAVLARLGVEGCAREADKFGCGCRTEN